MSDIAIKVEGIGKKYLIGHQKSDSIQGSLKNSFSRLIGNRKQEIEEFWAIKDISFEIKKGEAVGIIGKNGAGKSTLLKILSRITHPTTGRFEITGRVSSLLEVGTGFHPELSGRENIFLNGTILGMTRAEIKSKFDEIVEFSGVEKFLDTPVKRYSSGMYVRLAFAVAAHLEPEILIIDEVLAVGDAEFQKKCLGKMDEVTKQGRTVLFVSHNMVAVSSLCPKAILLSNNQLSEMGPSETIIQKYLITGNAKNVLNTNDRTGNGLLKFENINFYNHQGKRIVSPQTGANLEIGITYSSQAPNLENVEVSFNINDISGIQLLHFNHIIAHNSKFNGISNKGEFRCAIPKLPLPSGQYTLTLFCRVNGDIADWLIRAYTFEVESGDFYGTGRIIESDQSKFYVEQSWNLRQ